MNINSANEHKSRVLIVDDEPGNIRILSSILGQDYTLSAATNGIQALEIARSQSPHIILLDMIMPEMSGLDVCKALKDDEATRDIPIIFVTSMGDEINEERGLDEGAVDYISKPVSAPIVKARVKIHIHYYLSLQFLESLLSEHTTSLDDAKAEAKSLLVFY